MVLNTVIFLFAWFSIVAYLKGAHETSMPHMLTGKAHVRTTLCTRVYDTKGLDLIWPQRDIDMYRQMKTSHFFNSTQLILKRRSLWHVVA